MTRGRVFTGAERYSLGRGRAFSYGMSPLAVIWNIHEPYHRMKVYETPQR